MTLRIALAQMPVGLSITENARQIHRAIDLAQREAADILLTPEGSLSGYTREFDRAQLLTALHGILASARLASVGLALGTCFEESDDGLCYNELRFYSRNGDFLGFHSKQLRCGPMDGSMRGEIADFAVRPLKVFDFHGITIGGLICNDLWANPLCTPMPDPHLTHQLAGMGAPILFHAVNGGRTDSDLSRLTWHFHEANLRMRALASRVWIATVDNCAPASLPCSAPSGVIHPEGHWEAKAPAQGEAFVVCEIPGIEMPHPAGMV